MATAPTKKRATKQPSGQKKTATPPPPLSSRALITVAWIAGAIVVFGGAGAIYAEAAYHQRVSPGGSVGPVAIGGFSYDAAAELVAATYYPAADRGITLTFDGQTISVPGVVGDEANPELNQQWIRFDEAETGRRVRQHSEQQSTWQLFRDWVAGWSVAPSLEIDRDQLLAALRARLGEYETPAKNAGIAIAEDGGISFSDEMSGEAFDYSAILNAAVSRLHGASAEPIEIALLPDTPDITVAQARSVEPLVTQILQSVPLIIVYDEFRWAVTEEQLREWLALDRGADGVTVTLATEPLRAYLETFAVDVEVPVQEAKFTMAEGRVEEFQPSQVGRAIDYDATIKEINASIVQVGMGEIDLVVRETQPEVTNDDVNNLGIREQIGIGTSNFKGSPKNRRHNIAVGADTLNGILVKPGEEFSLVQTLGSIDAAAGYLPELVIKGNKTVPEYGGGLCQIGTTAFRVALNAGLPILERKNHSYRVSYYEPAGTDATIYDPKPDFRFLNDTGNHILLTTEIIGDELVFRIFGTADGRTVVQTEPRIYNIVNPGPRREIPSTDVAPGEVKCIENAHAGADAEFSRTVTYPDGVQKVDEFKSHYKAWPAVCLVGTAPEA